MFFERAAQPELGVPLGVRQEAAQLVGTQHVSLATELAADFEFFAFRDDLPKLFPSQ